MSLTIESVKTACLVGRCVLRGAENKTKQLWKMQWVPEHKELVRKNDGRVYLMVARAPDAQGIIKKIGKSECKGGMYNTLSFYQGGLGGSPSVRSFGIHHLIAKELQAGNQFEIWGIWSMPVAIRVPGLFAVTEMFVTPSIHSMETKCCEDYKGVMGDFPPWNYQERGASWPKDIYSLYQKQIASRSRRSVKSAKLTGAALLFKKKRMRDRMAARKEAGRARPAASPQKPDCQACKEGQANQEAHYGGCMNDPASAEEIET